MLVLSLSLCISASAVSYIPDDVTYQNLNGQQLAIKVYTLLPDQNPDELIEEDFEYGGYLYSYADIVKEELTFSRQFDSVYLMLNNYSFSAKSNRAVYVALTRAKSALHIHTNTDYFDRFNLPFILRTNDSHDYPEPDEILLELGHRDVNLGYFKYRQQIIPNLRCGSKLKLDGEYLCLPNHSSTRVAKLSKRCMEQLEEVGHKGYRVCSAEIRFIVWWKGQDDPEESAIILPNLYLSKESINEYDCNQKD